MIISLGVKLYTATEVAGLIGISRDTLSDYAKRANIPVRRIQRIRYYTEEEIRNLLQIPGANTMDNRKVSPMTPEEESKFWERIGNAIGDTDTPVEEGESVIYYDPTNSNN